MNRYLLAVAVAVAAVAVGGCATTPLDSEEQSRFERVAELNLQLGVGYIQSGRLDVAQEKLRKAIQFDDDYAEAHNALGVLYEETEDISLARQHYERALEIDPEYALARVNYGRFLCNHGNPERGEAQFLVALHSERLDQAWMAYTGAGVCARLAGDFQRAEGYFRQALAINPNLPDALWELATLHHQLGQNTLAQENLNRYHRLVGTNAASLWLALNIEDGLGNRQQRQVLADQLKTRFPNSPEAQRL